MQFCIKIEKMKKLIFVFAATLIVVACKKKDDETTTTTPDPYATQKTQLKTTYADIAFASYDDALIAAEDLNDALIALADNPSQSTLDDAKQAWLESREAYGESEIFRFVDGPIDNPSDGPEGLINAWPMDEAYVDYVDGVIPAGGIINNLITYPTITIPVIIGANEFGGETNISAGYHAIEFLLWGQDLSTTGAGNRPYTDYVSTVAGSTQERRGTYLKHLGTILVEALQQVRDAWNPSGVANYRSTFLALDNNTALRKMFNSLRVLSGEELSGERMLVAYTNEDQEDEHSCFSDNTHRDIALNAQGIKNLYTGTYLRKDGVTTVTGFSMEDLTALVAPAKNTEVLTRLNTTTALISAMHVPFDRAIVEPAYRPGVFSAIESLQTEATLFTSIAADFNIVF